MKEVCEFGNKNCERFPALKNIFLGTKFFLSISMCRSLVMLTLEPENLMLDVNYMCKEFGQMLFKS